jgi:hypothetical protein
MKPNILRILLLATLCLLGIQVRLRADLNDWARQATSTDPAASLAAQNNLRSAGPEGLIALQQLYSTEIQAHRVNPGPNDDQWRRIASALDRVGAQYDDYASGLYWYTDLAKAEAAAKASGKPILSLRLLGHLDEELSCANSRFFRATLYSNAQVAQLLRDKFVLHWASVRAVPIITIDFGNGRKLVQTITGNSIHYVLNADGRAIDALPGLYNARTFIAELQGAADAVAQEGKGTSPAAYQEATTQRLLSAWRTDLAAVAPGGPDLSKANETTLQSLTDDNRWSQIAARHFQETAFDPQSTRLIESKFPSAWDASRLTMSKTMVETPALKALRNLQGSVTADTMRDNYMFRPQILAFLEEVQPHGFTLDQINDWVYAQIFLTPKDDPWLGFAGQDVFSGIAQNGEQGAPASASIFYKSLTPLP